MTYAIQIRNLKKSFHGLYALDGLNMNVPAGSIYGFIGENGSGKSTTMKLICGHLVKDSGKITLFGKRYTDAGVRMRVGALIENTGCFPNSSIYDNLKMQAINLGIQNADEEIHRVLKIVRMEHEHRLKFKKCSLGMKQRVGIAMAIMGEPALLILDEPINGLDTDGMRIMREILTDITENYGCTVLISSHILGELEKIATHYGIIRQGKLIAEISAKDMDNRSKSYVSVKSPVNERAVSLLQNYYENIHVTEDGIQVFGVDSSEEIVRLLLSNQIPISQIKKNRVGLEEYYINLMTKREVG